MKRGPGNGAFVVSGVKSPFGLHALLHASEPRTALGRLGKLRGFPTTCGGRPNELPLHRTPTRAREPQARRQAWTTCERFDDGRALFTAVRELGLEGVVAKKHPSLYRPNDRGWVKIKNPNYWRRDADVRLRSDRGSVGRELVSNGVTPSRRRPRLCRDRGCMSRTSALRRANHV